MMSAFRNYPSSVVFRNALNKKVMAAVAVTHLEKLVIELATVSVCKH